MQVMSPTDIIWQTRSFGRWFVGRRHATHAAVNGAAHHLFSIVLMGEAIDSDSFLIGRACVLALHRLWPSAGHLELTVGRWEGMRRFDSITLAPPIWEGEQR